VRGSISTGRLGRARIAAFAWGVFLFALTSWPSPPHIVALDRIPNFDKLVHFGLYSTEAFFLYFSIRWPGRTGFSIVRVAALVGGMAVWGMADEVHQTWIPGRSCDIDDVAADVVWATAGAIAASALSKRRRSPPDEDVEGRT
jgi:VanZ family protein